MGTLLDPKNFCIFNKFFVSAKFLREDFVKDLHRRNYTHVVDFRLDAKPLNNNDVCKIHKPRDE